MDIQSQPRKEDTILSDDVFENRLLNNEKKTRYDECSGVFGMGRASYMLEEK